MGCSERRCILSGLPIQEGDKAYGLPVFFRPDKQKWLYSPLQDPIPVCLPVLGYYDGYGSIEDIESTEVTDFLCQKLDYSDSLDTLFQNIDRGEVPFTTMVFKTFDNGLSGWRDDEVRLRLSLIRADIYEILTTKTPFNDYAEPTLAKCKAFFEWLENLMSKVSEDPVARMTWEMGAINPVHLTVGSDEDKQFEPFLRIFQKDQHNGMFISEWRPYLDHLFELAEAKELVGNLAAMDMVQQLIRFQQLCYNMWEMGLTFDPKPYAGQGADPQPLVEFYKQIVTLSAELGNK